MYGTKMSRVPLTPLTSLNSPDFKLAIKDPWFVSTWTIPLPSAKAATSNPHMEWPAGTGLVNSMVLPSTHLISLSRPTSADHRQILDHVNAAHPSPPPSAIMSAMWALLIGGRLIVVIFRVPKLYLRIPGDLLTTKYSAFSTRVLHTDCKRLPKYPWWADPLHALASDE